MNLEVTGGRTISSLLVLMWNVGDIEGHAFKTIHMPCVKSEYRNKSLPTLTIIALFNHC